MILRLARGLLLIGAALSLSAADKPLTPDVFIQYQQCVAASTKDDGTADGMIEACRQPAEAGIPGAQYALGAGLLTRNQADDRTTGIAWLEKAAAARHPAASFLLGGVLVGENSPAGVERGRALLRYTICVGYPPAVSAVAQAGATPDKVGCVPSAEEDFSGEWIADMKWVKVEPVAKVDLQLKLVLEGSGVRVFMKTGAEWIEAKAGKFNVTRQAETISVSTLDTGWDFDGKWIESWVIQVLRTGPDEAFMSFLRTVNNPQVPSKLSFRTFSTLAEGKAVRTKH